MFRIVRKGDRTRARRRKNGRDARLPSIHRFAAGGAAAAILACSPERPEDHPALVFHTGDAFTVEFVTRTAGYPALLHVGPRGDVSLVYPNDATTPRTRVAAGTRVRLPASTDSTQWVFEGDPGWESFVLVVGETPAANLEEVLLRTKHPMAAGRSRFLHDLEHALRSLGGTETLEVLHLP